MTASPRSRQLLPRCRPGRPHTHEVGRSRLYSKKHRPFADAALHENINAFVCSCSFAARLLAGAVMPLLIALEHTSRLIFSCIPWSFWDVFFMIVKAGGYE